MTTAEKITLGVSVATALGVGALLKSLFDHFLARPEKRATIAEKEVTIADKSVQIANALMSRMESELARVQTTHAEAQKEGRELRAELAELRAAKTDETTQTGPAEQILEASAADLASAVSSTETIQRAVDRIRELILHLSLLQPKQGPIFYGDLNAGMLALPQSNDVVDAILIDVDDDGDDDGTVGAALKRRR
ncbi:hypothetical protein AB0E12_27260 [Micromonospora chersina]|uniref:hypothetical protein n=1 Tax=Micromonospora chersina TaxID=47854 RepID=UPI0033F05E86